MKIFDQKNPKHIQILKEELVRAKRILKEYNENEIWKNMSKDVHTAALISIDADMGEDFASEYADTESKVLVRDSNTGRVYYTGSYGVGDSADNLGNHTATQALEMP